MDGLVVIRTCCTKPAGIVSKGKKKEIKKDGTAVTTRIVALAQARIERE